MAFGSKTYSTLALDEKGRNVAALGLDLMATMLAAPTTINNDRLIAIAAAVTAANENINESLDEEDDE